jgi:hypothetical protein
MTTTFLIRYRGQVRVNQVGVNYEFPHYSTVLGAILASYHRQRNTPVFPRIDMLALAAKIDVKLSIGYRPHTCGLSKDFTLGSDYSSAKSGDVKVQLATKGAASSPVEKFVSHGDYYILVSCDDPDLKDALLARVLSLGERTAKPFFYEISIFDDNGKCINGSHHDLKSTLSIARSEGVVWLKPDYDRTLLSGLTKSRVTTECLYTEPKRDSFNLCLVSQIEIPGVSGRLTQGLYSACRQSHIECDLATESVSYRNLYTAYLRHAESLGSGGKTDSKQKQKARKVTNL